MPVSSDLAGNLRRLLISITFGRPGRREVNEVVSLCHDLATAMLRRKISPVMLGSRFHYTSHRDMAFDCIGELCQQGTALPKIRTYFAGLDLEEADSAELLFHLRRLVSSSVNQTLFRIYGETDPHLAKILRNVKLAARATPGLQALEILGDWYVVSTVADRNGDLPLLEQAGLEGELSARGRSGKTIPDILGCLSGFLTEQTRYARMVPLLELARAIRSLYAHTESVPDHGDELVGDLIHDDVVALIRRTCRTVKGEFEPRYVGKKAVSTRLFDAYMTVVEQTLTERLWGPTSPWIPCMSGSGTSSPL